MCDESRLRLIVSVFGSGASTKQEPGFQFGIADATDRLGVPAGRTSIDGEGKPIMTCDKCTTNRQGDETREGREKIQTFSFGPLNPTTWLASTADILCALDGASTSSSTSPRAVMKSNSSSDTPCGVMLMMMPVAVQWKKKKQNQWHWPSSQGGNELRNSRSPTDTEGTTRLINRTARRSEASRGKSH